MKKVVVFLAAVAIIACFTAPEALAKRLLPRATSSTGTVSTTGVGVKVKFRSDRKGIIATFTGVNSAKTIDYVLSYDAGGVTQAATGSIDTSGPNGVEREIIFGSCSKGVCRYDNNITNAKFVVTIVYPSGRKVIKTFTLKV